MNHPMPVHPRACGELAPVHRAVQRMRGTRSQLPWSPVHPRACGELEFKTPGPALVNRFIPAHAGNSTSTRWEGVRGSSPRMRGTPDGGPNTHSPGFIPAHAGNSCDTGSSPRMRGTRAVYPVHPRACGELFTAETEVHPRACGELEALSRSPITTSRPVHPRACGELWYS